MLSASALLAEGKKKRFMVIAKIKMIPANHHETFEKKSAVLLVPNIVPTFEPPNVPARPPPLLDCKSTTIIKTIARITVKVINKLYIFISLKSGSGGGIRTPGTWIMIPLL